MENLYESKIHNGTTNCKADMFAIDKEEAVKLFEEHETITDYKKTDCFCECGETSGFCGYDEEGYLVLTIGICGVCGEGLY